MFLGGFAFLSSFYIQFFRLSDDRDKNVTETSIISNVGLS